MWPLQQISHPWQPPLRRFLPIAVASVAVAGSQFPAQVIQFSVSYQPGTSFEQIVATLLALLGIALFGIGTRRQKGN